MTALAAMCAAYCRVCCSSEAAKRVGMGISLEARAGLGRLAVLVVELSATMVMYDVYVGKASRLGQSQAGCTVRVQELFDCVRCDSCFSVGNALEATNHYQGGRPVHVQPAL